MVGVGSAGEVVLAIRQTDEPGRAKLADDLASETLQNYAFMASAPPD